MSKLQSMLEYVMIVHHQSVIRISTLSVGITENKLRIVNLKICFKMANPFYHIFCVKGFQSAQGFALSTLYMLRVCMYLTQFQFAGLAWDNS